MNELAARTALRDITEVSYSKKTSNNAFETLKPSDIWIQFQPTKENVKQVLDALKNNGFEFSEMVQKEYDAIVKPQLREKPWEIKSTPAIRYVQWCDKYGCPAVNGCGDCKRQIYGCHTRTVKVKVS